MRVYEAIAEQLARAGAHHAFAFLARDNVPLVGELSARLAVLHTRHEHVAVGMADGYARIGGGVGIASIGEGVGLTNALNAIVTAAKAHSGILVFTGEVPGAARAEAVTKLENKFIQQRHLLDSLGVRHVALGSAATAAADVRALYDLVARYGETYVVIVPDDVAELDVGDAPSSLQLDVPGGPAGLADVDRDAIVEVLEDELVARRTVILAGRGAMNAGARDELLRLGEATGALLATSAMAKGLFAGSPYAIGVSGSFATPLASELLGEADLVLAFGASLNHHTTYLGSIFGKARLIQIDTDKAALGRYRAADLTVVADARLVARALADALERKGHRARGYRTDETKARIAAYRAEFRDESSAEGLDPRTLMIALDKILPADRTVIVDAGNHQEFPIIHLAVPSDRGAAWAIEYGAIGCGLGLALGAAVARPDRLTVLCIGDGGLMMTLGDLDTAVRYGLRLLVVVSNNSALGGELYHLRDGGWSGDIARYDNPSFEAMARSLRYEAATIRAIEEVELLKERVRDLDRPMLVDCIVTTAVEAISRSLNNAIHRLPHQRELERTGRGTA